ncbi:DUF3231 family protein [Pelotomaculum isophthalicicum JI]|uniref:DUF3231 family protein n=1 Tax=Pelotomaculum isophthalicicum JI TaxID=947010 RepID=A0A9X4H1G2_9FIRM|nr:DUF3231 family protein [Pelotomaculum isophthalicicum]MDF9408055.1 DUF3231 family protein [Pelotomaculum isophthalicicum JI]
MEQQTTIEAQGTIQEIHHHAPLTSSEIAILWRTNVYYSMLECIYKHFLNTLDAPDLRPYIEDAISMFEKRVNRTSKILKKEGPIPKGFGDEDIDLGAPRLFTDLYYYYFTLNLARIGLQLGGMNLSHSVRKDVRDFYTEALMSTTRFYNRFSEIMLEKGIYIRPPITNIYKEADVIEKQNFLRGFLGERRPLLAEEIDQLFFGIRNNELAKALATGFLQVAKSEQVRAYMVKGVEIARKLKDILSSALQKENIPVSIQSGELVTDSTIPPLSDKLMMQNVVVLIGIVNYATSIASSLRHDLIVTYTRLIGEAVNYGEDGINIMIENGWFEEPPRKIDRRELAKEPVH